MSSKSSTLSAWDKITKSKHNRLVYFLLFPSHYIIDTSISPLHLIMDRYLDILTSLPEDKDIKFITFDRSTECSGPYFFNSHLLIKYEEVWQKNNSDPRIYEFLKQIFYAIEY